MSISRFSELKEWRFRAAQVYLILIGAAHLRRTLTYGDLADILHFKGAGVFAQILDHILCWCKDNQLPSLTSIVVSKQTGRPGDGFTGSDDPVLAREAVYSFDWYDLVPPTPDELDAARAAHSTMKL